MSSLTNVNELTLLNNTAYLLCKILQYFDGYLTDSPLQIGFTDLPVTKIVMAGEIQILSNALRFIDSNGDEFARLTSDGFLGLLNQTPRERLTMPDNILSIQESLPTYIATDGGSLVLQAESLLEEPQVLYRISPVDGSTLAQATRFRIESQPSSSITTPLDLRIQNPGVIEFGQQKHISVTEDGFTGIGTIYPDYTLDVAGNSYITSTLEVSSDYTLYVDTNNSRNIGSGTNTPIYTLDVRRYDQEQVSALYTDPNGSALEVGVTPDGEGFITFDGYQGRALIISHQDREVFTVKPNGAVGVFSNFIVNNVTIYGGVFAQNNLIVTGQVVCLGDVYADEELVIQNKLRFQSTAGQRGLVADNGPAIIFSHSDEPIFTGSFHKTKFLYDVDLNQTLRVKENVNFTPLVDISTTLETNTSLSIPNNIDIHILPNHSGQINASSNHPLQLSHSSTPAIIYYNTLTTEFQNNQYLPQTLTVSNNASILTSTIQQNLEISQNFTSGPFLIHTLQNQSGEINNDTTPTLISIQSTPTLEIIDDTQTYIYTNTTFQSPTTINHTTTITDTLTVHENVIIQNELDVAYQSIQINTSGQDAIIHYNQSLYLQTVDTDAIIFYENRQTEFQNSTILEKHIDIHQNHYVTSNQIIEGPHTNVQSQISIAYDSIQLSNQVLNEINPEPLFFSHQSTPALIMSDTLTIPTPITLQTNTSTTIQQGDISGNLHIIDQIRMDSTSVISPNQILLQSPTNNFLLQKDGENVLVIAPSNHNNPIEFPNHLTIGGNLNITGTSNYDSLLNMFTNIYFSAVGTGTISGSDLFPVGKEDLKLIAGDGIDITTYTDTPVKAIKFTNQAAIGVIVWISEGNNIYYDIGYVGFGTSDVTDAVTVNGSMRIGGNLHFGSLGITVDDTYGSGVSSVNSIVFNSATGVYVTTGAGQEVIVHAPSFWGELAIEANGSGLINGSSLYPETQESLEVVAGNGIELTFVESSPSIKEIHIQNIKQRIWSDSSIVSNAIFYQQPVGIGTTTISTGDSLYVVSNLRTEGNLTSPLQITTTSIDTHEGQLEIQNDLSVQQNLQIYRELNIDENAIFHNLPTIPGTLTVLGNTSLSKNISVSNQLSVTSLGIQQRQTQQWTQPTQFHQDVTIAEDANIKGDTTVIQNFTTGTITRTSHIFTNVTTQGDANFESNFNYGNTLYVNKTTNHIGIGTSAHPNYDLYVLGNLSTTGGLNVEGAIQVPIQVEGNVTAMANASVTQDVYIGEPYGTKTLYIDTQNKRVGINTNVPTNELTVIGDVVVNGYMTIMGNSGIDLEHSTIDNLFIFDELVVGGNFTVLGNKTELNTRNTGVQDNLVVINNGEVGPGVSAGISGFYVDRGYTDGDRAKPRLPGYYFVFKETLSPNDTFYVGEEGDVQPVLVYNTSLSTLDNSFGFWDPVNRIIATSSNFYRTETSDLIIPGKLSISANPSPTSILTVDGSVKIFQQLNTGSDFSVNTSQFTASATTGDITTGGTLTVATTKFSANGTTGNTTIAGTLASTGTFSINTTKVTASATTGNFITEGFFKPTGTLTIGSSKFVASGSSGDTTITGQLQVGTNAFNVNKTLDYIAINKATPAYPLDVNGPVGIGSRLWMKMDGGNASWIGLQGSAGDAPKLAFGPNAIATTGVIQEILFRTADTTRIFIKSNGQIGFNSNPPSTRLDVYYSGSSSDADTINLNNSSTGYVGIQYRNANFPTTYWQTTAVSTSQFILGRLGNDELSITDSGIQLNNTANVRKWVMYDNQTAPGNNYQFMGIGIKNPSNYEIQYRVKDILDAFSWVAGTSTTTETSLMRLLYFSRLGIGTTTPTGPTSNSAVVHIHSSTDEYTSLHLTNSVTTAGQYNGFALGLTSVTPNIYVYNYHNSDLYIGTNNLERFRLFASSPSVGIGTNATTNPLTDGLTLHLHDTNATANNRNPFIKLTNTATGVTATDGFAMGINASDSQGVRMWNYENSAMNFKINNAEKMIITAFGNVGIGTTNFNQKLSVYTNTLNPQYVQQIFAHPGIGGNPATTFRLDSNFVELLDSYGSSNNQDQAVLALLNGSSTVYSYNRLGFAALDASNNPYYQGMIAGWRTGNPAYWTYANMIFETANFSPYVTSKRYVLSAGTAGTPSGGGGGSNYGGGGAGGIEIYDNNTLSYLGPTAGTGGNGSGFGGSGGVGFGAGAGGNGPGALSGGDGAPGCVYIYSYYEEVLYTSSGTHTFTNAGTVYIILVGGGGYGGSDISNAGGGGGAGYIVQMSLYVHASDSFTVTVGAGGSAFFPDGQSSSITYGITYSAPGGKVGNLTAGGDGSSGGGANDANGGSGGTNGSNSGSISANGGIGMTTDQFTWVEWSWNLLRYGLCNVFRRPKFTIRDNGHMNTDGIEGYSAYFNLYDDGPGIYYSNVSAYYKKFINYVIPAGSMNALLCTQTGDNVSGEGDMRLTWTQHLRTSATQWGNLNWWKSYGGYSFTNVTYPQLPGLYQCYDNGNYRVGIGMTTIPSYQLHLASDSAAKPGTSAWTVSSDERLKENIVTADTSRCHDIIKHLPLRYFKWRDIPMIDATVIPDRHKLGWIAQEVEQYFPNAVHTISKQGNLKNVKYLDSDQIYAVIYGAMQKEMEIMEQRQKRREQVEHRIQALQERYQQLEQKILLTVSS